MGIADMNTTAQVYLFIHLSDQFYLNSLLINSHLSPQAAAAMWPSEEAEAAIYWLSEKSNRVRDDVCVCVV